MFSWTLRGYCTYYETNQRVEEYACLEDSFGGIALHVVSVDNDLNDAEPNFIRHVVAGYADQVQNDVHVPRVVRGVLLSQDRHFQNLNYNNIHSIGIK